MKKLIRSFVFETNSSSAHCVAIAETMELLDTIEPNENGDIILMGGDFDWSYNGESIFTDAWTKANYLAVYAKCYSNDEETSMTTLNGVLRMQTGAKEIKYHFTSYRDEDEEETETWGTGHINHQSNDNSYFEMLFNAPTQMLNFIFNPRSVLLVKGDGSDVEDYIRTDGLTVYGW